jgi:hypothetical protein
MDLGPIWQYVFVLIPYATYPILWLPIYLSTVYVILRRSLWPTVGPLCLFAALYSYPMAKGYPLAFARQVMLLLPVFCIFAGLAFGEVFPKLVKRPFLFGLVTAITLLLIIPSAVFDRAYGQAMGRPDVRNLLRQDLTGLVNKTPWPILIGVSDYGAYFYTVMPGVFPLNSDHVSVELQHLFETRGDFFVIGLQAPLTENWRRLVIQRVEGGGGFHFVKAYSHAPTFFGKTLDLSNFPPDMTYPFPAVLLFRKVTEP